VGAVIGTVVGWVASKIPWKKVKEWSAAIVGGAAGLIALPFVGIGAALGIGVATTVGSVALGGGLGGVTLAGAASGVAGFLGAIGGAFIGSVATPVLITLLGFPVAVALILFIINSGAYVVPPGSPLAGTSIENSYIGVEKTATPPGPFQNSDLPKTITYNITVTAKKGSLTNITVADDCKAVSKTGSVDCPTANIPTVPDSISPSAPYSFSYTTTYDSGKYSDSMITNTVTVTATADGNQESASGSTAIIIGNPPTGCITFDNSWNSFAKQKNQVMGAIAQLSSASVYMSTLCAGHTITLTYSNTNPGYAGITYPGKSKIILYIYAVSFGPNGTLYTLTHETGHLYAAWVVSTVNGKTVSKYVQFTQDKLNAEGFVCTYLLPKTQAEDFAESIAIYVAKQSNTSNGCLGNFKTHYPNHWLFERNNIFYQDLGW